MAANYGKTPKLQGAKGAPAPRKGGSGAPKSSHANAIPSNTKKGGK